MSYYAILEQATPLPEGFPGGEIMVGLLVIVALAAVATWRQLA